MSRDIVWHPGHVEPADRAAVTGGPGATLWLTGLSGSGKSTIALLAEKILIQRGRSAYTLDGDNIRHGLNSDLGFSSVDRSENVRRVGEVARLMADAGLVVIAPLISPYQRDRDAVRKAHKVAGIPSFSDLRSNDEPAHDKARSSAGVFSAHYRIARTVCIIPVPAAP